MLERLRQQAARLRLEVYALYLAARDAQTPWYVRVLVVVIVAYALSPIDLIPDFIPVLGLLDDLVLLPLAIALAIKLTPVAVLERSRVLAEQKFLSDKPVSRTGAITIVLIWALSLMLLGAWLFGTD